MEELVPNRNGWLESATRRQCTNCFEIFDKNANHTMRICNKCNTARVKSQSAQMKMYRRAKARASERGLEFNIGPDDVVIPNTCPILGTPIYVTTGKSGAFDNSPSLDRIDNALGYVKGNVWVISQLANAMKANANNAQLLKFAEWVNNCIEV